jgi:hypothetical protein
MKRATTTFGYTSASIMNHQFAVDVQQEINCLDLRILPQ